MTSRAPSGTLCKSRKLTQRLAPHPNTGSLAIPRIRRHTLVAQHALLDLAVLCQWHRAYDAHVAGNGEIGDLALAMPDDIDGLQRLRRLEQDGDRNLVLSQFRRQRVDGASGDRGVREDGLLDLPRGDVLAAPADRILHAV